MTKISQAIKVIEDNTDIVDGDIVVKIEVLKGLNLKPKTLEHMIKNTFLVSKFVNGLGYIVGEC